MIDYIKTFLFILLLFFCTSATAAKLDIDIRASSWKGKSQADTVIVFSEIKGEVAYTAPSAEGKSEKYLANSGKYKVLGNNSIEIIWNKGKRTIAIFEPKKNTMILANAPFEEVNFSQIKPKKRKQLTTYEGITIAQIKPTKHKQLDTNAAANLRKTISAVQAAYYGFIDKYRQIPGDWIKENAASAIPGVKSGGNGDGKINGGKDKWAEPLAVWEHLSKSGLFESYSSRSAPWASEDVIKAPQNLFGGYMLLLRSSDYYDRSATPIERTLLILGNGIPVEVLAELDRLIDDGYPQSGVLRLSTISEGSLGTATQSDADCVETAGTLPSYNVKNIGTVCNAAYLY